MTMLVFAPDTSPSMDVIEVLKRYPGDAVRAVIILAQGSEVKSEWNAMVAGYSASGHAYLAHLVTQGKRVVVVRPDGVVCAMVHGDQGIESWQDLCLEYPF